MHQKANEPDILSAHVTSTGTLTVEALLADGGTLPHVRDEICVDIAVCIRKEFESVMLGTEVTGSRYRHEDCIRRVVVADYVGPESRTGIFDLRKVRVDVKVYHLRSGESKLLDTLQSLEDDMPQARIFELPHETLDEAWDSLIFYTALPATLLHCLTQIVRMSRPPGLNLTMFNWNNLCLLHGPPGSGKSTLCRALAQKLSIRLHSDFHKFKLVDIQTGSMLSKYFGESGKLIAAMFERVLSIARDPNTFVYVIMDEVETVAGTRQTTASGDDCRDGLRATNQLLTVLDRLRNVSNVLVVCTSNLVEAIDSAFLDRVDIKQKVPRPPPEAIYNIFRSCLNELVHKGRVLPTPAVGEPQALSDSSSSRSTDRDISDTSGVSSSQIDVDVLPEKCQQVIPSFSELMVRFRDQPAIAANRVWRLAEQCEGFSGRTLRRLPLHGIAKHTWKTPCTMDEALSSLEAAVAEELEVQQKEEVNM